MDEESEFIDENEDIVDEIESDMTEVPPTEGALGKYLREYRLLNSLLLSLGIIVGIIGFMIAWTIVVPVGDDGGSDFGDAGAPAQQQQQEKQKVVKLMQRQQKQQPSTQQTFKTTAISDISLPDFNELDVKDLAPVVEAAPPTMTQASMNNESMKSALKGISLSLPKVMQQRCDPKKRVERLKEGGGKDMTEKAIVKGLNWLKNIQDSDGGWGLQDKNEKGDKTGGDELHRDAMTGMALLAFLGHCELQDSPEFGPTVKKGIDFLTSTPPDKLANYESGGKFLGLTGPSHQGGAYSHPIRAYALCEAYTMTKIPKLKEYAARAAKVVIDGQNPNGGWAYKFGQGVGAHVDLSVTGWCIQALKAFALTGITDPQVDEAMDKAIDYVKKCQDSAGRFKYKLDQTNGKNSLTGTGVLSLQIWKNAKSAEAQKGLDYIIENRLFEDWAKVDVYEWYYHAQACFQSTGVSSSKYWREWNKNFQQVVVKAQASDGHWPHTKVHWHGDSDMYRTTMTILMLEVYYRYAPMTKV